MRKSHLPSSISHHTSYINNERSKRSDTSEPMEQREQSHARMNFAES